jgi:ABC-type Fe3+ transport system substrate-binding protein
MLFVDYFLSAEGQTVQMGANYASARTNLPSEASPWTYANIVKLAGGPNKMIFETEPPAYNSTFSTSVDQAFATLMSS